MPIHSKYTLDSQRNVKSKYFIRELFDKHYGKDTYKVIVKRLERELGYFEIEGIEYQLSFDPIYKHKFGGGIGNKILLEIQCTYQDYQIFIYIHDAYPFKCPILKMDRISIQNRKYIIQDGLENTPIYFLHSLIAQYAINSVESDLISVKDFIDEHFIVHKKMRDEDIDPRRVYYQEYEHHNSPSLLVIDYYDLVCRGIDLALHSK